MFSVCNALGRVAAQNFRGAQAAGADDLAGAGRSAGWARPAARTARLRRRGAAKLPAARLVRCRCRSCRMWWPLMGSGPWPPMG
jgi:hypothetical protein